MGLNVAFLCPLLSNRGGGLSASVISLAQHLGQEPEIDVELIGFEAPDDRVDVRVRVLRTHGPSVFPIAPALGRHLAVGHYNIVHTHGLWTWASIAAATWARRSQGALIISPHGMLDDWALANSRWRKFAALRLFENKHLSRAFCMHALTKAEASSIINAGGAQPIAVIPNGIAVPAPQASEPLPSSLSRDSRSMLLFLGRLHPKKGIVPLLQAWANALVQSPNLASQWRLVIAGWDDGGYLKVFQELTGRLGIGQHVTFCGPLFGNEKVAAYRHASAFILPSYSEGLPMTILEAWSFGCPVFATKHCNLPEGFAAGAAIEISTNADEMACVLVKALAERERLALVGARGPNLVESRFTWTRIAQQWLEVYAWALGHRNAPEYVIFPKSKSA
jgi:glycosyltransferase involved in cell wall biosynthesis